MKGTRPLTTEEIIAVSKQFDGVFEVRNRSLFMLGVSVGGRISELLALKLNDVWQNGQPVGDLLFEKNVVKGKETARMIPVNDDGREAIAELIEWHRERYRKKTRQSQEKGLALSPCLLEPRRPLFPSRKFGSALSRSQAHRILEAAFQKAGLNGKLATHSLRKTFAQRIYDASGDIFLVKEMLGHKAVETTKQYLGVSYARMQAASKAIEVENNRMSILLHSDLTDVPTDTLITEMLARGVDMSSAIEQMQTERTQARKQRKVIPFPKVRAG